MKEKLKRFGYMLSSDISRLVYIHRYYLIIFAIVFLISFITGVMTCVNYSSSISCEKLINIYLLSYLKKDSSYISFFLMHSLYFLIVALFVTVLTRNIFVIIIDGVILSFLSYILGFDVCVVIISLGLSGVIFGVLVYGLLQLCVMLCLIVLMSIASRRVRDKKSVCQIYENSQYVKMYCVFFVLAILILFVLSILFGIIHIFVIVD